VRHVRSGPIPRLAVALVASAVVLAGCSGSDDSKRSGAEPASSTSVPEPVPLPLTGEMTKTLPTRGVLIAKIDNTPAAIPQQGLGNADLIVEELVEGGLTRLAVFYHSKPAKTVGPVRSMRTSDINIVGPTRGLLAASGAARRVLAQVTGAGIKIATPDNSKGFSRDGKRVAPYNLMLNADDVSPKLSELPEPRAYLPWAGEGDTLPTGKKARTATMKFSPMHTTSWTYDKRRGYLREDEAAQPGHRFHPATLLVLTVRTKDAGYRDPAGNPVPETVLAGAGDALLLHKGRVVKARWHKGTMRQPLTLTTQSGQQLKVPPGHTWIELVPTTGEVSTSP
jgi:hypothetical protein